MISLLVISLIFRKRRCSGIMMPIFMRSWNRVTWSNKWPEIALSNYGFFYVHLHIHRYECNPPLWGHIFINESSREFCACINNSRAVRASSSQTDLWKRKNAPSRGEIIEPVKMASQGTWFIVIAMLEKYAIWKGKCMKAWNYSRFS